AGQKAGAPSVTPDAGQKAGAPSVTAYPVGFRANIQRVKAGDIISRFRVQNPLPCLPGELPLPLYRAQDIAARSWVVVQRFPEDAPRQEVEEAVERAELLKPDFPPLVDKSFDPPAVLAWSLGGGEMLRRRLQRSPLSPEQAADLGLELARALRRLHRAGVVHGGLRPANVQLQDGGRVGLLAPSSLGPVTLAVANEAVESPTLWTAAYLSPEQTKRAEEAITGSTVPFTTADDVWTFGVVLYELVTGELPFIANTYAAMRRAVAVQPVDLAGTLPGSAPETFEAVLEAALDRDADRRRAVLDDVIGKLRQVRDELLPRVQPPADSVARTRARKAAAASDRSAASPAEPEWQSAMSLINRRRRRLARERPAPALWRVLAGPLLALLLTAAAVAAWFLL
ncbi:MAG: protein kinase, partial [Acidobacteria bacterium]|nr:protein kinase [Acidobacteriota bacterium]